MQIDPAAQPAFLNSVYTLPVFYKSLRFVQGGQAYTAGAQLGSGVGSGSCRTLGSRSLASVLTSVCTVSPPYPESAQTLPRQMQRVTASVWCMPWIAENSSNRPRQKKITVVTRVFLPRPKESSSFRSVSSCTQDICITSLPCFDFTSFFNFLERKKNQEKIIGAFELVSTGLNQFEQV